ncbi:SGNH/GDSL hydrolase family protein [Rhizohabitans arisaemae]|uniref:SGNH/GDSL hydrolase family protein n=1 Tax=Rhizohabitans arisaemae TaxID=2720610 RepID=UPI0024B079EC|nr:SGNH/GDSL hydrolase family protein [Rhizohabitans arisaemae]
MGRGFGWIAGLGVGAAVVLGVQGVLVRRRTPRLPEAGGDRQGVVWPAGEASARSPLRIAVLGESTAAGVGVNSHEDGFAGHLARSLAVRTGRAIAWQVAARSGANTRVTVRDLVPQLEPADAVVVLLGVNELLELRRPLAFERDLVTLAAAVRRRLGPVPIVLAGMAPVGRFPALPQPLRGVMGVWAAGLDRAMVRAASAVRDVRHVPAGVPVESAEVFAADGFHPGAVGYRMWAAAIAPAVAGLCRV